MAQVIDALIYYNEASLFAARYDLLKDVVGVFCIFEAGESFTGLPKSNDFRADMQRIGLQVPADRLIYRHLPRIPGMHDRDEYEAEREAVLATGEVNAEHWFKEHMSRQLLSRLIREHAAEDDVVLLSDADELPTPDAVRQAGAILERSPAGVVSFCMSDFIGSLSCNTGKRWEGTYALRAATLAGLNLSMVRRLATSSGVREHPGVCRLEDAGWHFSSFGGPELVERKIRAWGHQELNRWDIRFFLGANIALGKDIFGRDLRRRRQGTAAAVLEDLRLHFPPGSARRALIEGSQRPTIIARLMRLAFVLIQVVRRIVQRLRR